MAIDFAQFCGGAWTIYPKSGEPVPFQLNPAQQAIEAVIREQQAAGVPVRIRVLKYRQAGVSLYSTARMLFQTITTQGATSISIADKQDLPRQWLRRLRSMHEQLHPDLTRGILRLAASNAAELWFDRIDSRYHIGSAEGQTPGMGETIRYIHCSEVASWREPDSVLFDLIPAVPPSPGTVIIQESTGRAVGDWWYERYHEAKQGEQGYRAVFLPWFIQPEYRADPAEIVSLTSAERVLRASCGLDDAQLAWRRRMIRDEFHGAEAEFANQYPATEEEAFLSGGLAVFSQQQLAAGRSTVRPPAWRGDLRVRDNPAGFELVGADSGTLLIYDHDPRKGETPRPRTNYVIGADVQWGTKDTADYDVAVCQHCQTGRTGAVLRGRWDFGDYARQLAALGHYYSDAMLAPERNSRGEAVVNILKGRMGNDWSYPRIYRRRVSETSVARKAGSEWGWLTNEHTKAQLIAYAKELLDSEAADVADATILAEMQTYIRDESGRCNAVEGQHDDALMAWMIASFVSRHAALRDFEPLPTPILDKPAEQWSDWDHRLAEHLVREQRQDAEEDRRLHEMVANSVTIRHI